MVEPLQTARRAFEPVESLAGRPGVGEVLRFFARERRWIDEQHLNLCRIPAPTFLEAKRAEWLEAQFSALGWDAKIDRAGNVTAQLPGAAKDGPVVALTAHMDTVLAPRNPEEIRIDGKDRFLGPGISDNGAGLAGLLAIAKAIVTAPSVEHTQRLLLVANVGEEGEGNLSGMKFLCRQSPYAARLHSILVLDGPDTTHITADALACRRFEVTVTGPGGHSWSDHGMANPIHGLARAITWYADARDEEPPRRGASSWNFGVIEGGSTVNAIPASARVKVDLRSESPGELDDLANQLAVTLERALLAENERALTGRVTGKIRETGSRPGGHLAEGASILRHILAVDHHLGIRSRRDCASTDANVPLSMGIPAVSIGAGGQGGGAHTANEWYAPDGRDLGLRRAFLIACRLLEEAAPA
ncbi:MAG: M20/M25/M40 family metallo-hydrolase [Bryobacterales bacterium]|nr:M20/M25/M40 family metallo-hydrolase [Bryobacterales bacterium]